ncbi:MAG: hypothetical protein JST82_01625 [Bacteroidetes bacterium]|nr:hypothetical protein [Bacteroidota bacterium]
MKKILTLLLILLSVNAFAQTGMFMNRFYITGSLALGKEERTFADTSAWLQLGKDTTNKGLIFPRVILDSFRTIKRAVYIYDLKDSVLYHFDGTMKVRYMTYKDTNMIKQIITRVVPPIDTTVLSTKYYVNNNGFIKNGGNTTGATMSIGANDNYALNLKTNNTTRVIVTDSGKVGVGVSPTAGQLHVNGVIASDGNKYVSNSSLSGSSGTYKDATWGLTDVGANGSSADYQLINNPTSGTTVFMVPHGTNKAHYYGQVEVKSTANEVQIDMASSPSGHLYAGVSTGTFDVSNRGFLSFGDTYGSSNSNLVFGTGKIAVGNANLLVGTYTDNGIDKGQFNGTVSSQGLKVNNLSIAGVTPYNIIQRYNDGSRDGMEILCGGATGGYAGGFKVRTLGINATTSPKESFVINNNVISMGHHGTDVNGNNYFNASESQVNIARDNTDGQLLNLWNRRVGHPVIITFGNDVWGAGGPMATSSIISEVAPDGYRGYLSLFTNNGVGGSFDNDIRALLVDGYQNVGIGVSRNVTPTYLGAGLTLPSARLHVLGSAASTPVSIFQSAPSQTADISQWQNSSGTTLAKIDKDGNATIQKLQTAQPSSNGAGVIKIGKIITGASVTLQTDKFLEVDVDGTIYKLAIVQ